MTTLMSQENMPAHQLILTPQHWQELEDLSKRSDAKEVQSIITGSRSPTSGITSSNKDLVKQWLEDFMVAAKTTSLPPDFWFIPQIAYNNNTSYGSMCCLMTNRMEAMSIKDQDNLIEVASVMFKKGCSVWAAGAVLGGILGIKKPSISHVDSQSNINYLFCMKALKLQSFRLKMLLKDNDSYRPTDFIDKFCMSYDQSMLGSHKNAEGVLSDKDKKILQISNLVMENKDDLMRVAKATSPEAEQKMKEVILDADVRRANKQKKVGKDISPNQIKKELTPLQKSRLAFFKTAIEFHSDDTEMIQLLFENDKELKKTPSAAALKIGGSKAASLLAVAIQHQNSIALESFEKWGTNIWLASSQDNQPNAIAWALGQISMKSSPYSKQNGPIEGLWPIAKMLMKGAWIAGERDPKAYCMQMLEDINKNVQNVHVHPVFKAASGELLSYFEKMEFESVMGEIKSSTAPEETAANTAKKPRARSI